jgi:hypothetical protein
MDTEQTIAEIECLDRIFAVGHETAFEPERFRGCESQARRFARA